MDAACTIQDSIHVFSLVRKYVSRILGTYHAFPEGFLSFFLFRHLLFLSHDHFLNHFSTDRASLSGCQVTVVALF